jgi:predicted DNA-binding antitoxin AbrB/MazE fold protein
MAQIAEAVYSDGVLKPSVPLNLSESQRVRLIIEPLDDNDSEKRRRALQKLKHGIQSMNFRSAGTLPIRDELHDRI